MNSRLFALVPGHRHIDLFGPDDAGLFSLLARPSSWSVALATLASLPARSCPIILGALAAQRRGSLRGQVVNVHSKIPYPSNFLRVPQSHL